MQQTNVISGAVLTIFGIAMMMWFIPAQIEEGPEGMMSPRLVPQMMMGAITLLSIALVLTNLRGLAQAEHRSPISHAELVSLAKHAAVFAIAVTLFLLGSPLLAGVALIGGMLLALGERRPLVLIGMPALILLGTWLLFYKVLGTAIV
ncbi:tripartite tricarboxylate transporter TctB family protein [Pseudooceanicola aestuarii]|uniref:tripartite tricarboxylate transporter TctB family protein n=1 Tax=Pseudooceanicola aestuarii TaxID=2697319 RepID=UPI0013D1B342|nr:tripartite tricarboxylate transporter TctB family protein [Pseudooceanicola aestuarii]